MRTLSRVLQPVISPRYLVWLNLRLDFVLDTLRLFFYTKIDKLAKNQNRSIFVIPAQAGIHSFQWLMDSRLRGNDMFGDFLRDCQNW
jgi:hypothetical protein